MPIQPAIPSGSVLDPIGLAQQIADLRRQLGQLDATRTIIGAGTITGAKISSATITASNIAAGTITGDLIAAGAIVAGNIAAGSIQTTHLASQAVTAEKIQAGTITSLEIAAGTIQAGDIQAGTITGDRIASNTITATNIAGSTITADKLNVTALSSITSNAGSITAGTIQGATVQTAGSGSRVVIDSAGIRGYALNGTTKVFEINTGTGIASFTGIANIDPTSVIPGGTITTNTLPGDRIVTGSIQTLQLAAGAVVANTISAGAVTAQKLSFVSGSPNLLYDAGFEFPAAEAAWEISTNAAFSTDGTPKSGTKSTGFRQTSSASALAQIRHITARNPVVVPAKTYTFSVYMRQRAATANRQGVLIVEWLNSAGGIISTSNGTAVALAADTTTWTRLVETFTSPALSVTARLYIRFQTTGANFPGTTEVVDVDEAMVEPGEVVSPTFSYREGDLQPGSVGNTKIAADSITTDKILAGTIQGGDIAGSTITGTNIAGTTITGSHIAASTITAGKLSVATLSAITADAGLITAGTFRGPIFETSSSNPKLRMDATDGLYVADASGNKAVKLTAIGGLDFMAGTTSTPSDERVVRWLTAASAVSGEIKSYDLSGTTSVMEIGSYALDGLGPRVTLIANDSAADRVEINLNDSQTTLMETGQISGFLQLATAAKRKVAFGNQQVTWNGTGTMSVTVSHGLGQTPVAVLVTHANNNSGSITDIETLSYTSTQFTLTVKTSVPPSNGTLDNWVWLAIG